MPTGKNILKAGGNYRVVWGEVKDFHKYTSSRSAAQVVGKRPGSTSGPGTSCGFTLWRINLTSATVAMGSDAPGDGEIRGSQRAVCFTWGGGMY